MMPETAKAKAPKSADAIELNELALIMRHIDRLSTEGKVWLRDKLADQLKPPEDDEF